MKTSIRVQLSTMMFLNYFIWGAWYVTLVGFVKLMEFSDFQGGLIYQATAIAAMISPFFVGMIADRFFATERVLAVLHLIGAGLMYLLSITEPGDAFGGFYLIFLGYSLCYMPTIALANSLSFHHMPDPNEQFPAIRLFGTLGWIVAGLMLSFFQIESGAIPYQIAAASSLIMVAFTFTLPNTPPKSKGKQISTREVLGLDALSLMKSRPVAVLVISSILVCIPLSFYYNQGFQFLSESELGNVAAKMTLGQMAEVFFLLAMPFFFRRYGVKMMIIIGLVAWVARYVLFAFGNAEEMVWMLYGGILLHGICYDFFFVTGQLYIDEKAPVEIRGAAQGLITFATYGIGMFIGFFVSGWVTNSNLTSEGHNWTNIWLTPAFLALAVLVLFYFAFNERGKKIEVKNESIVDK